MPTSNHVYVISYRVIPQDGQIDNDDRIEFKTMDGSIVRLLLSDVHALFPVFEEIVKGKTPYDWVVLP